MAKQARSGNNIGIRTPLYGLSTKTHVCLQEREETHEFCIWVQRKEFPFKCSATTMGQDLTGGCGPLMVMRWRSIPSPSLSWPLHWEGPNWPTLTWASHVKPWTLSSSVHYRWCVCLTDFWRLKAVIAVVRSRQEETLRLKWESEQPLRLPCWVLTQSPTQPLKSSPPLRW